jgi:hypothetical protein
MAAKQGLTAHLSQASEDAKRAFQSRTGSVTSSWFSNLNTVCTIKSAPPRSPEVLQMLATKSGWLFKRNEQHIWQARWCCVVPHTMLYYFDANTSSSTAVTGSSIPPIPAPTAQQQEELNAAVQTGYANRKQHEKRSSLYLFNGGTQNNNNSQSQNTHTHTHTHIPDDLPMPEPAAAAGAAGTGHNDAFFSSSQPAGIIDLECYTSVHRSTANPQVLELAGDDQVNPDLRAFYFCTNGQTDSEDWTDALLNGRHAALQDESEAYKQVCDGFATQLQVLHCDLDDSRVKQEEATDELYRVRSHAEDVRRSCWRMVEESLVAAKQSSQNQVIMSNDNNTNTAAVQDEFLLQLEQVRSQDMGVPAAVRLLIQYTETIQAESGKLRLALAKSTEQLQNEGQSDQARVSELQAALAALTTEYSTEKKQWESQVETLQQKCQTCTKELQDVQRDLSSTRMEVTMYQSQQKQKLAELSQHKKILKKEVIDLRCGLDDAQSELAVLKHQQASHGMRAEQERQKSQLLERYVDKMESQVQVQQNMMEMMSQSVAGSVYGGGSRAGGGGGSVYGGVGGVGGGPPGSVGHHSRLDRYDSPRVVRAPEPDEHELDHDLDDDDINHDLDDDVDDHDHDHDHLHDGIDDKQEDHVAEGLVPAAKYDRRRSNQRNRRSNVVDDVDNKSHVSELTEDRTQRHFEGFSQQNYSPYVEVSPRMSRGQPLQSFSPRTTPGPPSYIIGVTNGEDNKGKKQTISSAASLPAGPPTPQLRRRGEIPRAGRHGDSMSVSSENRHRLSVAQRARLEADQQTTPVRARLDEKSHKAIEQKNSPSRGSPYRQNSVPEQRTPTSASSVQGSQQSGLWRRMEEVVLGPRASDTSSSDDDDDDDDDCASSVNSYTQDVQNARRRRPGREGDVGARSIPAPKARLKSGVPEEKKSTDDSVSMSVRTIA